MDRRSDPVGMKIASEKFQQEQLQFAKQTYDKRVESLNQQIGRIFEELKADDTLNAMKNEPTCAPFVEAHIKEMTENALLREKEAMISKISDELIAEQGKSAKANEELQKMQEH